VGLVLFLSSQNVNRHTKLLSRGGVMLEIGVCGSKLPTPADRLEFSKYDFFVLFLKGVVSSASRVHWNHWDSFLPLHREAPRLEFATLLPPGCSEVLCSA